jgi:RNA polymerase sigma-70 factor (ECF subfamily)
MDADFCDTTHLAALMRAGDLAALERFSRCYGARLIAVARRSCRGVDDAEDAVQDALMEASRTMESYRGEGSPLAWMSTLVVRRCGRMGRGRRNDPALHVPDVDVVCGCTSPEIQASDRVMGERLSAALLSLSETDRYAVMLADQGYTGPEIAEELGLTPNAVRGRLKRSRAALRGMLADWR